MEGLLGGISRLRGNFGPIGHSGESTELVIWFQGADFNFSKYESKTSLIGLGPLNGRSRWKNISLRGWQWIRFAGHLRELKNASWGLPTAKD